VERIAQSSQGNLINTSNVNNNSSSANLFNGGNPIKIKKLKIINFPTELKNLDKFQGTCNVGSGGNPLAQSLNLRKSASNPKREGHLSGLIGSGASSNKLTFENVFSFRKHSSNSQAVPVIINNGGSNIFNTQFNQASLQITQNSAINTNPPNNINYLSTQNNHNSSHTPIIINNIQSQPQISININNFNINNYNINSNKIKKAANQSIQSMNTTPNNGAKSSESLKFVTGPGVTGLNNQHHINGNNSGTHNHVKNEIILKKVNSHLNITKEKDIVSKDIQVGDKNDHALHSNAQHLTANSNPHASTNSKLRIVKGDFNPNQVINNTGNVQKISGVPSPLVKSKSIATKKAQKIETIIDGNNDSFINELADLLNNVDVPSKIKNENNNSKVITTEQLVTEKNILNLDALDENFDEKTNRILNEKNENENENEDMNPQLDVPNDVYLFSLIIYF
jgi:hypothetical protein